MKGSGAISLIVVVLVFSFFTAIGSPLDPRNEIAIQFHPKAIELPNGDLISPFNLVKFSNKDIMVVLNNFGCYEVEKVFPYTYTSDSV